MTLSGSVLDYVSEGIFDFTGFVSGGYFLETVITPSNRFVFIVGTDNRIFQSSDLRGFTAAVEERLELTNNLDPFVVTVDIRDFVSTDVRDFIPEIEDRVSVAVFQNSFIAPPDDDFVPISESSFVSVDKRAFVENDG